MIRKICPGIILIMSLMNIMVQGQTSTETALTFLPSEGHITEWEPVGEPLTYQGDQLYDFIDDGAAIYMEYGFDHAVDAVYASHDNEIIEVDIYVMSDDAAACGIFHFIASGKGTPVTLGAEGLLYGNYLIFWKGNYFVTISGDHADPQTVSGILDIGQYVDDRMKCASSEPEILKIFKNADADFNEIKYIRGLIALNDIYHFDDRNIFGAGEGAAGIGAGCKIILLRYDSPEESLTWLDNGRATLSRDTVYHEQKTAPEGFTATDRDQDDIIITRLGNFLLVVVQNKDSSCDRVREQISNNIKEQIR
jgi:hypothetical protein